MIDAMGYSRDEVFFTYIIKCYKPGNRIMRLEELTTACSTYLYAQIKLIKPKVIVALGKTAAEGLLKERLAMTQSHGMWKTYEGVDLMPTFHPAYAVNSSEIKRNLWADLQKVVDRLKKE